MENEQSYEQFIGQVVTWIDGTNISDTVDYWRSLHGNSFLVSSVYGAILTCRCLDRNNKELPIHATYLNFKKAYPHDNRPLVIERINHMWSRQKYVKARYSIP